MNELGQLAMNHWKTWLPEQYQQIPDPETHFAALGQTAHEQMIQIEEDILRASPADPDYLKEVGRRNMARLTARETILSELLPTPPQSDDDAQDPTPSPIDPTGMPSDPSHPLWADLDDDSISPAEFQARRKAWIDSLPTR